MLVLLLTLAASSPAAGAVRGFGYDDPRSAQIYEANDVAATPGGGFLITQHRKVLKARGDGPLRVVAGGGDVRVGGETVIAVEADLGYTGDVVALPTGGFAVTTSIGLCVVKRGTIRNLHVPGTGSAGVGLDVAPDGTLLVTNYDLNELIRVSPAGEASRVGPLPGQDLLDADFISDGRMVFAARGSLPGPFIGRVEEDGSTTVLAGGRRGYSGDGGPAVDAGIAEVSELEVAADGSIVFTDRRRVRRIDPGGMIDTIAGTGENVYNGDGIPAAEAALYEPASLDVGMDGDILVGDFPYGHNTASRLRRIDLGGTISTVAGMPAPLECDQDPYNGIQGSPEADGLRGTHLRDAIRGESGDDEIDGRDEADCLMGGFGDDSLDGGDGSDLLFGYDSDDLLIGGAGGDDLYGAFGDDRLIGGAGADYFIGYSGEDEIAAGRGDDTIDAQYPERESSDGPADFVKCGPGQDIVKANTYDRVASDCEILKGAIGKDR